MGFSYFTRANANISLADQRAVISGGTQGIGAGIALRLALTGAEVWLVGRSSERAEALLETLRSASVEAGRRAGTNGEREHAFFKADLSEAKEVRRVAEEIEKKAGEKGVDWLIECQGGPPNGRFDATPSGVEGGFAVQVLSRFGLAHLLTSRSIISRGVLMVAAPGTGGKSPLETDDLDFARARETGAWKSGLFGLLKQGARDGAVLDSVAQTLAERNPTLAIVHVFPGPVYTKAPANRGFPWPLPLLAETFGWIVMSKPGPGGFAEVPTHLIGHPDGQRYLRLGEANLFSPKLKRLDISPCVADERVRLNVWDRLAEMLG